MNKIAAELSLNCEISVILSCCQTFSYILHCQLILIRWSVEL